MTPSIRLTVLVENTAFGRQTRGEHGLAFWIEAGSKKVLLDTGQTPQTLVHNAEHLGIELSTADAVVLSHGHYDHTGGLEEVLRRTGGIPLFLHPGALVQRFSRQKDGLVREIGPPPPLDEAFLRSRASSITWTEGCTSITDELRVTGQVPRETEYEDTGGDFFLDATCETPDPIQDDQAVFFDTRDGTVVLLGCGHAGVVNTLRHVRGLTGKRPIHAVLGGTHLTGASRNRMDRTVEALRELNISLIVPLHCTGARAQARIASEFPDSWMPCHVGSRIDFPAPSPGPTEGHRHP
jgi:7,8-dihydropterin-6-yl-methyl-4-(beta-D-ribofuranosyl)aminobenzene 5'-phosphate synthase